MGRKWSLGKCHTQMSSHPWGWLLPKEQNKRWQGCGKIATCIHCQWECKMVQLLWKMVFSSSKYQTNTMQSSYSASGYMPQRSEKYWESTDTCTSMFIEAYFRITRNWKEPACLLMDKQCILWYINTMKYYSDLKSKEISDMRYRMDEPWGHCGKWNKSQKLTDRYCMVPLRWGA